MLRNNIDLPLTVPLGDATVNQHDNSNKHSNKTKQTICTFLKEIQIIDPTDYILPDGHILSHLPVLVWLCVVCECELTRWKMLTHTHTHLNKQTHCAWGFDAATDGEFTMCCSA